MFEDELLDLASYKRSDLIKAGLNISILDSNGVRLAFQYAKTYHALSPNDCFAMALAKETESAILLTGDGRLRMAAPVEEIEVRGLLWLCDEMNNHQTVTSIALHDALVSLDKDPFVRLPKPELKKRIIQLRSK
jgi:hypothetical protein